jgi:hypothetical protein
MVPETHTYCPKCGHQAHVCRLDCMCPKCARARRLAATAEVPAPLAPAITAALAALRRGAAQHQDDCPVNETPNPEGSVTMSDETPKATAPYTRELKRTPVSPKLAAAIRTVDELLVAELGNDFAYAVLGRGLLIAASNSKDGVVPPAVATDAPPPRRGGGHPATERRRP